MQLKGDISKRDLRDKRDGSDLTPQRHSIFAEAKRKFAIFANKQKQ